MDTRSLWLDSPGGVTDFPPPGDDLSCDVLVIGGGITGATAAWLLASEGVDVILVERQQPGRRDTAHTTGHLTYMTDTRLSDLVATHSRKEAQQAWQAGKAAMDLIESTVAALNIECSLKMVPGYLVAAQGGDLREERSLLQREAQLAHQMGFDVRFDETCPLTNRPGIRFARQMEFHPLRYMNALIQRAAGAGARIYGDSEVSAFEEDPQSVRVAGNVLRYNKVFIATHVPLQGNARTTGAALFQTKLALYSTYAVAAPWNQDSLQDLIWSDTADPFLYLRIGGTGGQRMVILGGEDYKTGMVAETAGIYQRLEGKLVEFLPGAEVSHRWSGQVVETVDGLPFIGATDESQFIATGFSGNGLTFGTVAAMMCRDWVLGRENEWTGLFSPSRRSASSVMDYLRENKDFPVRMITDRLKTREGNPEELKPGEGQVLEHRCQRMAAYRDCEGQLHLMSAICPHLGCIVAWNETEATWDCPCHGSRFSAEGRVIAGPAESDLKPIKAGQATGT